ncbi:MAG: hypothetical protein L0216_15380, partial [Planctomycetales bacterium]|nr:hypothetical protein [Planctomycetales bacterium]
ATCHGNHGAVPPGVETVGAVCGKCHAVEREHFERGPHAAPAGRGEMEPCVACHGNHRIVPAGDATYGACARCHEEGTKGAAVAAEVRGILADARGRLARVVSDVAEAERQGLDPDRERGLLEEARTDLLRLRPAQHALDPAEIRGIASRVAATAEGIGASLAEAREARTRRRLALLPVGAFLVLMSAGVALKRRRIARAA